MLKFVEATGLQNRFNVSQEFHPDINIITGLNGSGKTTLIKLLWYLISGNIERAIKEVSFQKIRLVTSAFELKLESNGPRIAVSMRAGDKEPLKFDARPDRPLDGLDPMNAETVKLIGPSLFFPTFRRVEGGFSTNRSSRQREVRLPHPHEFFLGDDRGGLDEAMRDLSRRLSVRESVFVCSVSTDDIERLLTTRYAEYSQSTNEQLLNTARSILSSSKDVEAGKQTSEDVLRKLADAARETEERQEIQYRPFRVLSSYVETMFKSKGIKVGHLTPLGQAERAIRSDLLSAGEKQMLGFLVYNAFYSNAVILIDEPELSLHVDWQRQLFPSLLEQGTGNQFLAATHSPFIYSKYPDKEILMGESRGE